MRTLRELSEPGREEAVAPKARNRGNFAVGTSSKEPGNISYPRRSPMRTIRPSSPSEERGERAERSPQPGAQREARSDEPRGWGPAALIEERGERAERSPQPGAVGGGPHRIERRARRALM